MKRFTALLLFLVPLPAPAQIMLGGKPDPNIVERAQRTIDAAAVKIIRMNVDEFEVLDLAPDVQKRQLYYFSSSVIVEREIILAGRTHSETGVRVGTGIKKTWTFPAKTYDWSIIRAKAEGLAQFVIVTNGGNWPAYNAALAQSLIASKHNPAAIHAIANSLGRTIYQPPVELDRITIKVEATVVVTPEEKPAEKPVPEQRPADKTMDRPPPIPEQQPAEKPVEKPAPAAPVAVVGLRVVLIIDIPEDKMTPGQKAIWNGTRVRDYLETHCAKDDKGKPSFRRWKSNQDVSNESPLWKGLWTAIRPQLQSGPQVVVVTDQSGEVFPWPSSEDGMLELLRKYGGP